MVLVRFLSIVLQFPHVNLKCETVMEKDSVWLIPDALSRLELLPRFREGLVNGNPASVPPDLGTAGDEPTAPVRIDIGKGKLVDCPDPSGGTVPLAKLPIYLSLTTCKSCERLISDISFVELADHIVL